MELKQRYPGKNIVLNDEINPTEIICEIEPTKEHVEYDVAIAVIDKSIPHYHHKSAEEYEVIRGVLTLMVNGKKYLLNEGEKFIIEPELIHSAEGKETWIKATSRPGWTFGDHILLK